MTRPLLPMSHKKPQQWLQVVGHAGLSVLPYILFPTELNFYWTGVSSPSAPSSILNSASLTREFSRRGQWSAAEEVFSRGASLLPGADGGHPEALCPSVPWGGTTGREGLQHDG